MALGKPILAGVKGEALELIKKGNSAFEAIPDNPKSIAKAAIQISKLSKYEINNINKKSRLFTKKSFNENICKKVTFNHQISLENIHFDDLNFRKNHSSSFGKILTSECIPSFLSEALLNSNRIPLKSRKAKG